MNNTDADKDSSDTLCSCKDRKASECPGEWEPGCDLGNNPEYVQRYPQTPSEREAIDKALGLWVCPWRICNTKQAQECRATFGRSTFGLHEGCGSMFVHGTTLEQARAQIKFKPKQ